ncbi:MAG TPA: PEGA domain-containing protein, partial [Vicinamibacterales bacterium]|nr:PEGA domain-containing protein [Vicinamibacterales bacterium]
ERRAPAGSSGRATARPRTSGSGAATASASSGRSGDSDGPRAVTRQRPRGDRHSYGVAVPRTRPRPRPIPSWVWHRPSYWYGYHSLGLGYFYYDPFWWGYPGYYGYTYYGPAYGGAYYVADRHLGSVRLKVKPRDAEVRVDGYYVGVVDQYDGVFQRLTLESGPHRIEIAKEGYEPLVIDIRVLPHDTVTYKGELRPK